MARIKVVGYIDTGDIEPEFVDDDDESGLSEAGFLQIGQEYTLDVLQDVSYTSVDD